MIIYSFHINHPYEEAFQMLLDCANSIGKAKLIDKELGHFFWKSGFLQVEEFYIQKTNPVASDVNMIFRPASNDYGDKFRNNRVSFDKIAEKFYRALMKMYPKEDFGVVVSPKLTIVGAKVLTNGLEKRYTTTSVRTPSLGGAILGGLAFGAGGAIIGGMSGRTRSSTVNFAKKLTSTQMDIVQTDKMYVQAVLSNGRYTEGWLDITSPAYRYIAINLKEM